MARIILFVVVIAVAGLVSLFTVSSKDVGRYNDAMVEAITAMNGRFDAYGTHFMKYLDGAQVDVAAMGSEVDRLEDAIRADQAKLQDIKVPDDEHCKKLHGTSLEYVRHQQAFVDEYRRINDYIAAHNPAAEADVTAVTQMLEDESTTEDELFERMVADQRSMASKHKLQLK